MKYKIKVQVFQNEPSYGKGVAQLMRLCDEYGSLSAAYKKMGMSNSKAWKILKRAEEDLGFELIERTVGGVHGGKSVLTPKGKEFLEKYDEFEKRVEAYANTCFEEIFHE
ncbi:MAG: LysR family transcriptional regulator [Erysipelotrichaceae bacterium]|uniref:winged helix-turn-helix domain-containing protein n=1 Tax=Floccifex sp. TaxID=2815810 RepID=UPI002A7549B4|nr:LysR family transcriptional regulator [Floccifex sp.]MDD7281371.1 LysR family transcriptional regulator [Erysipelotrichaceae bacterium]MDY2958890.1 LysR family transcriptional regulator [Floccifex sp.]